MKRLVLNSILAICVAGTLIGCGKQENDNSRSMLDEIVDEADASIEIEDKEIVDEGTETTNLVDDSEDPLNPENKKAIDAYVTERYYFVTGDSYLRLPEIIGDESEAINQINDEINKIYEQYKKYENVEDNVESCEVRYKAFENERYLSIIVSDIEYPNYGTDGNLHGWTFDKKLDKVVLVEDALEEAGLTSQQILSELSEKYRVVDDSNAGFIESDYIDISDICVAYKYDSNPTFYFKADYMVQGAEDWWTYCTYENGMPIDNGPWPGLGAISGYEDEYIIPGLYEYNTATNEDISKEEISLSIYTSDIDYDSYFREIGTVDYKAYDKSGNEMYSREFLKLYYDAYSGEYVIRDKSDDTFARFIITEENGLIIHMDGSYDKEFNLEERYES